MGYATSNNNEDIDINIRPYRRRAKQKRLRTEAYRQKLLGSETRTVWRGQRVYGGGPVRSDTFGFNQMI